ncbi:MAG: B12-binding domain-containing radical SAM protein [Candidatus Sumerlaeaceae bacterium]
MYRRVLLMNPPSELYRRDDRCQSKVEDQTVRVIFPPIELGMLAAIARECGAEVALKDYPTVGATAQQYIDDLNAFKPDLVLLNTTAHTIREDLAAFSIAREFFPGVRTIVKGEAVAVRAEEILKTHGELDIVLDGEPEIAFRDIVTGKPLSEVGNISWRDEDKTIRRGPQLPLIPSLDDLPFPARDLFDNSLYRSPENGRMITAVYAQRGCPAKCIYCPAGSMYDYKVRERSIESVIAEIEDCVKNYGIRDFLFHGDTFTLHKKWLIQLCQAIVERGLEVHWGCNSRVDTIDDERAEWMRKAGCWVVAFGFEHGDQEILDKMKKGARVEKAYEAVRVCRRHALQVHGFFVIGTPWETEHTLEKAFEFAKTLDTDYFDFNIAYPLPGTELHDIVVRDGLFETSEESTKVGYAQAAVRTYELSSAALTDWRKKALFRLYRRPSWIFRTVRNAAANGTTMYYAKEAWFRLNRLLRN